MKKDYLLPIGILFLVLAMNNPTDHKFVVYACYIIALILFVAVIVYTSKKGSR